MPGTLPLCTKKPTPKDLPESIEFDPQGDVSGLFGRFPQWMARKALSRNTE
jgi:hypothetical protein